MPLRAQRTIWALGDPPLGTSMPLGHDVVALAFSAHPPGAGATRRFYIEHGVVNPRLETAQPVVDRVRADGSAAAPCHAWTRAGAWGPEPVEQVAHVAVTTLATEPGSDARRLGDCRLAPDSFTGRLAGDRNCPDPIAWQLILSPRQPPAPEQLWTGVPIALTGSITLGDMRYHVDPDTALAHAERRTGKAWPLPWFRIASADLATASGAAAAFIGVAGEPRRGGVTARLHLGGRCLEFLPGPFWRQTLMSVAATDTGELLVWKLVGKSPTALLEVSVSCPKIEMLRRRAQQPDGRYQHAPLWRGGTGSGEARLYARQGQSLELIDTIAIRNALCEFGDRASLY